MKSFSIVTPLCQIHTEENHEGPKANALYRFKEQTSILLLQWASLPLSLFKVALLCPLINTGLSCFPICLPLTVTPPLHGSLPHPISLSKSVLLCFYLPRSFSHFKLKFHCTRLTKPCTSLVYFSPLLSNKTHTVVILPRRLHRQSLNWAVDDSHSLNFTAILSIHAGAQNSCMQQTFYTFYSF